MIEALLVIASWYQPLDDVRSDGAAMELRVSTPYLGIGAGDCSIYPYQYYGNCAHPAYDIGSAYGGHHVEDEPVRVVEAGTVVAVDPDGYCGKDVFVDHGGGVVTRYCHLNAFAVEAGQWVGPRDVIGFVGGTYGYVPHLHFEARADTMYGAYLDLGNPLDWPVDVAPAEDPCGGLDYSGACDGATLSWCEGGAVQVVDCAARGEACGWRDDVIGNDCVAPEEPAPADEGGDPPVADEAPVDDGAHVGCGHDGADEGGDVPVDDAPVDDAPIVDDASVDDAAVDEGAPTDAPSDAPAREPTAPVDVRPPDAPDDATPSDDGASCAAAPAATFGAWLVVVALVGAVRRRRPLVGSRRTR